MKKRMVCNCPYTCCINKQSSKYISIGGGFTVDIFKSTCEAITVCPSFTIVKKDNSFKIKQTFPELSYLSPPLSPTN